ncbi:MAG TPA: PEP-CTERM sorting domain-containing protein [Gemmatales bacterium]|nr:PEP-CTERM sorting domain-containing protein [Gemmatales bacterium]
MKLRAMSAAGLGCFVLFAMPGLALAQNIVVPNSLTNVGGGADNGFPFNIDAFGQVSMRYQQVYASDQFSLITSPTLITAISFRVGSNGSSFSSTLPSMQINLSTTGAAPDGLSTSFASNVGGDDTQVFSGSLTLSSTNTGGPPPSFDIVISLQTPFLYDPAAGNLLMDVRNFGAGSTTQFDAVFVNGDSVSRVSTFNTSVNSSTADFSDTLGLVTQFSFAAVPEPTTWALIGVCTVGTGAFTWNRRRKNIKNRFAKKK